MSTVQQEGPKGPVSRRRFYVYSEDLGYGIVGPFETRQQAEAHPHLPGDTHIEVVSDLIIKWLPSLLHRTPQEDLESQERVKRLIQLL